MATKITVIGNTVASKSFAEAVKEIKEEYGEILDLKLYYVHEIAEELVDEDAVKKDLRNADIVLLDIRSRGRTLNLVREALSGSEKTVITLVGGSVEIMSLTRIGTFSPAKIFEKRKPSPYWKYSGRRNIKNMLLFVAKEYGGQKVRVEPPAEFPDAGIYHPRLDR
ncbi:MAG: DUF3479 domain-containing protein, partial [Candidatus Freyarchaeota archaeon]